MSEPVVFWNLDLLGDVEKADWQAFSKLISGLIAADHSLRGDLAHISQFFSERRGSLTSAPKSVTALGHSFEKFCNEVSLYTDDDSMAARSEECQNLSNFVWRKTDVFTDPAKYVVLVLYHAFAGKEFGSTYKECFINLEVGQLAGLIARLTACLENSASQKAVVKRMLEVSLSFRDDRQSRSTSRADIGGLLENGRFAPESLWTTLFQEKPKDWSEVAGEPSRQSYYVCYRLSSANRGFDAPEKVKLVKSFLVVQSPGSTRKYFTFKNFYQYGEGGRSSGKFTKRSAGAILPLGNSIAMYGTSQVLHEDKLSHKDLREDENHSGPKAFFFDANYFRLNEFAIPGLLTTMNNSNLLLSTKVVLVRSKLSHSDEAGIGTFQAGYLRDELEKLVQFPFREGSAEEFQAADLAAIWDYITQYLFRRQESSASDGALLQVPYGGAFSTRGFFD